MKSKLVQISDIGKVITGKTPPTKNTEYFGTEIPFLTPSDIISESKYVHKTGRSLSKLGKELLSAIILPPNSISVSCIGSDMGKTVFIQENMITNQQFNSIIPNDLVDPEFLYYFFKSKRSFLKNLSAGGSAQPIVKKSLFEEIQFLLFPLEIQINAGKILSDLDSKIHNLQNQNKILEQTAQAIFQSWFVDFDGVTEFEDSELGKIPKGWSIKSIKEIVSKKKYSIVDGPFGTQLHNDEYVSEGIPVVKVKNLSFNGTFLDNSFSYITEEKFNYLIRSAVYPGDILLAKTGNTIGKFSMLPSYINRALIASSNLKISPNPEKFNKFYIYNIIQNLSKIDYWNNISAGSTRPTITLSDVRNIDIIYPNDQIMKKYFLLVEPLYDLKEKNIISLYSITKTRDALLPKLMSGEIRV